MLSRGDRLAVAVSGGADSVALLAALRQLAPELGVTLGVAHVNHQLRGQESDADQAFVEQLAAAAGLPCWMQVSPVAEGENVEQAARQARLAFFAGLVARGEAAKVATAHTEDDQAETVLLRLLRGAGPTGLAAILPHTAEGLIRPALLISRAELRAWAATQGVPWREDRSNADPAFARNRLRATLLPELEAHWNPALKPLLAQTAQLAREDSEFLENEANGEAARLLVAAAYDAWTLDAEALARLPMALRRRVVRQAIARVRGDLHRIDFAHVEAVLALADSPNGDGRIQIPGVDILRSFVWLRFAPWPSHAPQTRNWSLPVGLDTDLNLPGGHGRLRLQLGPSGGAYNNDTDWLDLGALAEEELEIRNWRPGDLFQVETGVSPERVKLLFQQCRIPLWERRDWPMITRKDEIVWMLGMGVAAGRKADEGTARTLAIRVVEPRPSAVNMRNRLNLKHSGGRLLS